MDRTWFVVAGFASGVILTAVVFAFWPQGYASMDDCVLRQMKGRQLDLLPTVKRECHRLTGG